MALPTEGTISLDEVAEEFEDAAPHMMSEFYGADVGVPASGVIKMSDMRGKSNRHSLNITIGSNTSNYNVRSKALSAGWDGVTPLNLTLTIKSGVTVYSTSAGSYAMTVSGSFPAESQIHIINNGTILGKGGKGGNGGSASIWTNSKMGTDTANKGGNGASGGPALYVANSGLVSVTNKGRIAGGGGGGAGGGGVSDRGKPFWACGGSGGGGGVGSGARGTGGKGSGNSGYQTGKNGTAGTLSKAGSYGGTYSSYDSDTKGAGNRVSSRGGVGGSWGSSGGGGKIVSTRIDKRGASGGVGSAGKAVQGNSLITWLSTGTINGARSG